VKSIVCVEALELNKCSDCTKHRLTEESVSMPGRVRDAVLLFIILTGLDMESIQPPAYGYWATGSGPSLLE